MDVTSWIKAKRTYFAILAISAFMMVATSVPYVLARYNAGTSWEGVTPSLSNDALRYFARANDVTRGNLFPHNPYFIEHKDQPSPTPSFNDAMVAFPQLIGLSFNTAYYLNIFLWGLLFILFAARLIANLGGSFWVSILGAFLAYISVYGDMLRPGAMQIVFPYFLLMLLAILQIIQRNKYAYTIYAILLGLSAYSYIYLYMTGLAAIGVLFLLLLGSRDIRGAMKLVYSGSLGVLVSVPHFLNVLHLSGNEFYKETMTRIVFVPTHWPQIEAYYYGRWVLIGVIVVFLIQRYFAKQIENHKPYFFYAVAGGVLIGMLSNVFTGRDFDVAVHIGRFGIIWYLILAITLSPLLIRIIKLGKPRSIVIAISVLYILLLTQIALNIPRAMNVFHLSRNEVVELQEYSGVISWLNDQPESVVSGPERLMLYLPTLTKQYVLFSSHAGLFLLSDKELRERYLLLYADEKLTEEEFVNQREEYDGPTADLLAKASHVRYRVCTAIPFTECEPVKDEIDFVDVATLRKQFNEYYPSLGQKIVDEYKKYGVRYIVYQTSTGISNVHLSQICNEVYQDEYYSVCVTDYQ